MARFPQRGYDYLGRPTLETIRVSPTADGGEFAFTGLPEGSCYLMAEPLSGISRHTTRGTYAVYHPNALQPNYAAPVHVVGSASANL